MAERARLDQRDYIHDVPPIEVDGWTGRSRSFASVSCGFSAAHGWYACDMPRVLGNYVGSVRSIVLQDQLQ